MSSYKPLDGPIAAAIIVDYDHGRCGGVRHEVDMERLLLHYWPRLPDMKRFAESRGIEVKWRAFTDSSTLGWASRRNGREVICVNSGLSHQWARVMIAVGMAQLAMSMKESVSFCQITKALTTYKLINNDLREGHLALASRILKCEASYKDQNNHLRAQVLRVPVGFLERIRWAGKEWKGQGSL